MGRTNGSNRTLSSKALNSFNLFSNNMIDSSEKSVLNNQLGDSNLDDGERTLSLKEFFSIDDSRFSFSIDGNRGVSALLILILSFFIILSVGVAYFFLSSPLADNRLLAESSIQSFNGNKVLLEDGTVVVLPVNFSEAFATTSALEEELKKEGANLSTNRTAKEYGDRIIITSEVVSDRDPLFGGGGAGGSSSTGSTGSAGSAGASGSSSGSGASSGAGSSSSAGSLGASGSSASSNSSSTGSGTGSGAGAPINISIGGVLLSPANIDDAVSSFLNNCSNDPSPLCKLSEDDLKALINGSFKGGSGSGSDSGTAGSGDNNSDDHNTINRTIPNDLLLGKDQFRFKEEIVISKINFDRSLEEIFSEKRLLKDPLKVQLPKTLLDQKPILEGGSLNEGSSNSNGYNFVGVLGGDMRLYSPANYKALFINGFTYGYEFYYHKEWSWSKWGKTLVSLDSGVYAGAGLGVRAPFEVSVTTPSTLDEDQTDFNVTVEVTPKDASKEEMKSAGIKNYQLFNGKELVFQALVELSAKASVLGSKVLDATISRGFDNSRDFTPPMQDDSINFGHLVVHGKEFNLYYGGEGIYLEPTFALRPRIVGKSIRLDMDPVNSELPADAIVFRNSLKRTFSAKALSIGDKEDSTGAYNEFGLVLKNLNYETALDLDFRMKLDSVFHLKNVGSKRFGTPWITIYSFEVPLPILRHHDGTTIELRADKNRKYVSPVIINFNQTLVPFEQSCSSLHELVSEGTSVEGLSDAVVNVIVDGTPLGVVVVKAGVVDAVNCGLLSQNPDMVLNVDSFQDLIEFGNMVHSGSASTYDVIMSGLDQDKIKIEGSSQLTTLGLSLMPKINNLFK